MIHGVGLDRRRGARMSLIVRFCLPRRTALSKLGIAIAARIPTIAMAIKSST